MGHAITVKGQVTIPKPLRDHLGLRPGDEVDFTLEPNGQVVMRRSSAGAPPSRFARARAATRGRNALSTEEIMALTRGDDTA